MLTHLGSKTSKSFSKTFKRLNIIKDNWKQIIAYIYNLKTIKTKLTKQLLLANINTCTLKKILIIFITTSQSYVKLSNLNLKVFYETSFYNLYNFISINRCNKILISLTNNISFYKIMLIYIKLKTWKTFIPIKLKIRLIKRYLFKFVR